VKDLVKSLAGRIDVDVYERLSAYAILRAEWDSLATAKVFMSREALWDASMTDPPSPSVNYVEFGVYEGYSIRYFSSKMSDPGSTFVGLDSFEGLPEEWGRHPGEPLAQRARFRSSRITECDS
jgi:hypothetical protein